jgi:hypothetical protein
MRRDGVVRIFHLADFGEVALSSAITENGTPITGTTFSK